jgi:cytochrome b561
MNDETEPRDPQLQEIDSKSSLFLLTLLVIGIPVLGILVSLLR